MSIGQFKAHCGWWISTLYLIGKTEPVFCPGWEVLKDNQLVRTWKIATDCLWFIHEVHSLKYSSFTYYLNISNPIRQFVLCRIFATLTDILFMSASWKIWIIERNQSHLHALATSPWQAFSSSSPWGKRKRKAFSLLLCKHSWSSLKLT